MTTKKQQQENLFPSANENTAATPTAANSETLLATTTAAPPATELDALSIEQLTMEAKFYYMQMGQNAVEFGKRLIAIKKKVGHGNWQNWLADNFQLKERSARNFMEIAERFSNRQTFADLGYSKLVQMLALPAGEEEKFIEEKAAEGNPVENMTVKQEREEIKKYKAKVEKLEKQVNFILDQNNQLADVARTLRIENEALKDQPPVEVIKTEKVIPVDYESAKQTAAELQSRVAELQAQGEQAQKTIEDLQKQIADGNKTADPPADLQKKLDFTQKKLATTQDKLNSTKTELLNAQQAAENAKAELADAQKDAENAKEILAAEKHIEQLFQSAAALTNSIYYHKALKNYMQKHPNTKDKIGALRCICTQLESAYKAIDDFQQKHK